MVLMTDGAEYLTGSQVKLGGVELRGAVIGCLRAYDYALVREELNFLGFVVSGYHLG